MNIIPVFTQLAEKIFSAAEKFLADPAGFAALEQDLDGAGKQFCAEMMSQILEEYDSFLAEVPRRADKYTIQRHDRRTLITTFGDVTFSHTLFRSVEDDSCHYLLDEKMHLPKNEHFSEMAEVRVISEAAKVSYQHAADSLRIGTQRISKTAVMNKIHAVLEELPLEKPREKKECKYLYIEADEDHIHRQKAGKVQKDNCIIGKLVYVFEGKEQVCGGRTALVNPVYFGGQYSGTEGNAALWERVQEYIRLNYDQKCLKQVYISGDCGGWIRAGEDYIAKSVLVADRFHLMKYINAASQTMLDDCDAVKGKFYKYIYKNKPRKLLKLLKKMRASAGNLKPVERAESYILNNWAAIQRAFRDKHVLGCSAEGHVSNIYSDRMSSRPMGWSETGADRMCRLRCSLKSYGDEKIIDLVRMRRERACRVLKATGTEDAAAVPAAPVRHYTKQRQEAAAYAERIHAELGGLLTRKRISIRLHQSIL